MLTEQFKKDHPFEYHLYGVSRDGVLRHINSLYKDYNCTAGDLKEIETTNTKRIIAPSREQVMEIISSMPVEGKQKLYILSKEYF